MNSSFYYNYCEYEEILSLRFNRETLMYPLVWKHCWKHRWKHLLRLLCTEVKIILYLQVKKKCIQIYVNLIFQSLFPPFFLTNISPDKHTVIKI